MADSPADRLLLPLRRLRRAVLLRRRLLAALSAGVAVLAAVQAASPTPAPTTTVWTAARTLQGGALVARSSLVTAQLPPAAVPDGAVTDPAQVLGRPLAAPVARGEVLTGVRVLGPDLAGAYPGSAVVPVRLADAEVVDLLRPGDRVDLVAAPQEVGRSAEVLVRDVPVVAVPRPSDGAGVAGAPGRLVVLAVPEPDAADVAAATATAVLIPVWSR